MALRGCRRRCTGQGWHVWAIEKAFHPINEWIRLLRAIPQSRLTSLRCPYDGKDKSHFKELDAWYVEPQDNAATLYAQRFEALQLGNFRSSNLPLLGQGELPLLGAPMPAPMKSALAADVHANTDALQSFAQGARYEQSRYPVDFTLGFEAPFPHLDSGRSGDRHLARLFLKTQGYECQPVRIEFPLGNNRV